MKLEIKYLAPYLPYDLIVYKPDRTPLRLTVNNYNTLIDNQQWKPILRPLSDLTTEIDVNGEKFVPIEWLDKNIKTTKHKSPSVCFTDGYIEMSFMDEYQKLFEWHFDVFDLIGAGLAIDINTLQ